MPDSGSAKICGVCGDKAIAKNFGALSCESCKAFFRRNASKINEWILMVEQKQIRRINEEKNPVPKNSVRSSSASVSLNGSPPETQELDSLELDINDESDGEIITNIMQIEKYIDSDENNQSDLTSELTVLPIARPLPSNSGKFNEMESLRLIELFKALDIMKTPKKNTPEINKIDDTCLKVICGVMNIELETKITNLVTVAKCLNGFNMLCENDQISLLKFGSFEIFLLRLIFNFDLDNHNLFFVLNERQTYLVNLKLFKYHESHRLYESYLNYFTKMSKEWESDSMIMDLLTAVILFNPDRPKLIHRDMIKLQQQIYMYLLQRYLLIKYRSESESKEKFLRLLDIFLDLDLIYKCVANDTNEKECQIYGPLVREVLDMEV